jgi:putative ABC transport system permease protein
VPKSAGDIPGIKEQAKALGYLALTKDEFIGRTIDFYIFRSGFGMNLLIMTAVSFIVGLSVSGQTFYTFILENLDRFGALKAIGTTNRELVSIILFQTAFTSLTGYGLGVGLCVTLIGIAKLRMPECAAMVTTFNLVVPFLMVVVITAISSYFGVRRVLAIEPFEIFRG